MSVPVPFLGRAVAIDGGTSTTRARLIDGGRVVAIAVRAVGVRDNVLAGGLSPLIAAVRDCLDELAGAAEDVRSLPVVASGMLTSDLGIATVPHVEAPAGLAELAAGSVARTIPDLGPSPIFLVPGVKMRAESGDRGWLAVDLMRGEESETMGALAELAPRGPCAFLWPGSHTKLVSVDASGRITSSVTTLAGEITSTIARGTLIARSLPGALPDHPDAEAARLGLEVGALEGLGRSAFLVRVADVTGALRPEERAAFWIGAAIGDDAAHLARHPILRSGHPVWVGGREPQRSLYARQFGELLDAPVRAIEPEIADRASAIGAIAVGRAAGWFDVTRR